jgi:hypothetical protein
MSDDKKITDPHDPRLLAELKKKQAAEAKAKAAQAKAHNMDGKGRWADGTPVEVAKNLASAANKAKVKYGVQTPRSPFVSAWDATKKVWNIVNANQNVRDWKNSSYRSKQEYDKAVKDWTSNPTTETYNAWQQAGHYLHTDHVNLVKAQQELDAAHAKEPRPAPDQVSHVGFDFTEAGTGQDQSKVFTNKAGTAYKLDNGNVLVFKKDGSQITVDEHGKPIGATDKDGKPISVPKSVTVPAPVPAPKPSSAGTAGNTGGSSGSTGGGNTYVTYAAPAATTPVEKPKSRVDWAETYGTQAALVDSVPELKTLFNKAVAEQWSAAKFKGLFNNTEWYKTHNDAWRVAYGTQKTDPASWKNETALASELVRSTATDTGVRLTDNQVASLAKQSLFLSAGSSGRIDTNLLKKHVVGTGIITGTTGEALTTINDLKAHGADMGVQHDDLWYTNAAHNILHGDGNLNGWKKQISDVAKSKYAAFADQIDKGQTVKSLASPYINSMANLLEIPSGNISLNDHTINKALTNLNADSKPELQPIWQFETGLRKNPRWASTKNARDTVDNVTRKILSDFGLVS